MLARLGTIEGLDVHGAVARFGGREDSYVRVLRQFAVHYRGGLPRFDESLAAGDLASAQRAAHSLRGAAGQLGATRVEGLAGATEAAIGARAGRDEVGPRVAAMRQGLAELVAHIERHLTTS